MDLHEYQAKELLKGYGIHSPPFVIIDQIALVGQALKDLGTEEVVVKVQVHAGGRGKAGGVRIAKGRTAVEDTVSDMLGMKIVNQQTGPQGVVAEKVMLTPLVPVAREFYLGATIDRKRAEAILILSACGGMDIEEVAIKNPEAVLVQSIGPGGHLYGFQTWNIAKCLGLRGDLAEKVALFARGIAKAFLDLDASLLEINPLVLTEDGDLVALDAKLSIDDNALFRHPDLQAMFDPTQLPEAEVLARAHDLSYVSLDGDIGCMVNGAGLAMATMDLIRHVGGAPANFLDVGGGATKERVAEAFRWIILDPQVKVILVNIFGGIMNCVTLAEGLIEAVRVLKLSIPLVVRLEGTEVERARELLAQSGLSIRGAVDLKDAAQQAIAISKGA